MQETVELVHRLIGYPTAFLVGPAALLAFTTPRVHRRWGRLYVYLMLALYASGTWMTLTRHEWGTWHFARNVAFNLFGFSLLLHAYRAIHLFRGPAGTRPAALDRGLVGLQAGIVLGVLAVAVFKDTPMRAYALAGAALVALDVRELRAGFRPHAVLFRRHVRYVLASYFYLLTVVSIVHLDRALPRNVKWLWPAAVGVVVIAVATTSLPRPAGAGRAAALRWSVGATLVAALALGAYVALQLARGGAVGPQAGLGAPAA